MSRRGAAAFALGVSGILLAATGAGAQSTTQDHAIRGYEPLAVAGGLVSGRWRGFGLRPPAFLLEARGSGVGWHLSFRE